MTDSLWLYCSSWPTHPEIGQLPPMVVYKGTFIWKVDEREYKWCSLYKQEKCFLIQLLYVSLFDVMQKEWRSSLDTWKREPREILSIPATEANLKPGFEAIVLARCCVCETPKFIIFWFRNITECAPISFPKKFTSKETRKKEIPIQHFWYGSSRKPNYERSTSNLCAIFK